MQEKTTDRRDDCTHSPCCTTVLDRRIERMAVMDRATTSRTIVQQLQSVMHHSGTLVTFDAVFSRVEYPQVVHCFVFP
ncbi:hypothetical protein TNCV_518621 [Trichonephila clavipes]|nr:hypothetical protein TNCV_518621 [Trichonephila clavipes]